MTTIASQITSLMSVYSNVYSDADQRKHQNSASLAFVWGIHRDRWIPRTWASYAENVSIWWRHHEMTGARWATGQGGHMTISHHSLVRSWASGVPRSTVTWHRCMMCLFKFLPTLSFIYLGQVTQLGDVHVVAARAAAVVRDHEHMSKIEIYKGKHNEVH